MAAAALGLVALVVLPAVGLAFGCAVAGDMLAAALRWDLLSDAYCAFWVEWERRGYHKAG